MLLGGKGWGIRRWSVKTLMRGSLLVVGRLDECERLTPALNILPGPYRASVIITTAYS
jgi:hypothetical protein